MTSFEVWKDIPNIPGYLASSTGRIKCIADGRIMTSDNITAIYKGVTFRIGSGKKAFQVHRIIAITFLPNPENKPYVNHINCIQGDNRVENLEWVTAKENSQHALKMGRMKPRGIPMHKPVFVAR